MSQFFVPDLKTEIRGETARHITSARRFRESDEINIFDGNGHGARAQILKIFKHPPALQIKILEKFSGEKPFPEITLYAALIKPPCLRLCIEKTTELGITKFVPLKTARSFRKKIPRERLVKILIAACSQSGRKFIPSLDETKDFLIGIKDWKKSGGAGFIMSAAAPPMKIGGNFRKISFFVGPEGGFTEKETEKAIAAGLSPASLGNFVLRSETAAIAAVANCRREEK
ncbi:MAG: RsmE family RNA methyltransferase [bacterium]